MVKEGLRGMEIYPGWGSLLKQDSLLENVGQEKEEVRKYAKIEFQFM